MMNNEPRPDQEHRDRMHRIAVARQSGERVSKEDWDFYSHEIRKLRIRTKWHGRTLSSAMPQRSTSFNTCKG